MSQDVRNDGSHQDDLSLQVQITDDRLDLFRGADEDVPATIRDAAGSFFDSPMGHRTVAGTSSMCTFGKISVRPQGFEPSASPSVPDDMPYAEPVCAARGETPAHPGQFNPNPPSLFQSETVDLKSTVSDWNKAGGLPKLGELDELGRKRSNSTASRVLSREDATVPRKRRKSRVRFADEDGGDEEGCAVNSEESGAESPPPRALNADMSRLSAEFSCNDCGKQFITNGRIVVSLCRYVIRSPIFVLLRTMRQMCNLRILTRSHASSTLLSVDGGRTSCCPSEGSYRRDPFFVPEV